MILLDTNIVSTVMTPQPPTAVLAWLDRQQTADLYLSTFTIAEIGYGLAILPPGKRRRTLEDRFDQFVGEGFEHRILSFDSEAARLYGTIMGRRKELGRPMAVLAGQIAAIARANRFALATRNTKDFEECGLDVLNPFA
jgi:toxin FitB